MVDMRERERERLIKLIDRLDKMGDDELKRFTNQDFSYNNEFNKQAIQLGLLQTVPSEFKSKYKTLKEFLLTKNLKVVLHKL